MAHIPWDLFKSKRQQELLIQNHKFVMLHRTVYLGLQSKIGIQEPLSLLILFHLFQGYMVSLSLDSDEVELYDWICSSSFLFPSFL